MQEEKWKMPGVFKNLKDKYKKDEELERYMN
jgi:hypothetical protein